MKNSNQDPHAEGCAAGKQDNQSGPQAGENVVQLLKDIKAVWDIHGLGDDHSISDPLYNRLVIYLDGLKGQSKLRYMKHYRGDGTEPFEVENLAQIDMTVGQFALEDQADLKKRFLAGEFTKEIPLKSSAAYIWTEEY